MPYRCMECDKVVQDNRHVDKGPCDHDFEPLHDTDRSLMGKTMQCPECQALANTVMSRVVNGYEVVCCYDCADHLRAKDGQVKATLPPKSPQGYNIENPDPGTVWTFGPNDRPILEDLGYTPESEEDEREKTTRT